MTEKRYPLEGVTVVDFSTVVAGPASTRLFSDLGAKVIKVESKAGDKTRYEDAVGVLKPDSYCFTVTNSNKEHIIIDVKVKEGRETFLELLKRADIMVTNVRYQSLQKLGLDYETLKDDYPRLVYAHFSGYGEKGPDKDLPGYDISGFWSRTGALLDGHMDDSPYLYEPAYGLGDLFCSGYMAAGVLSALVARDRTGQGTKVNCSLLHTGLWANTRNIIPVQPALGDVIPLPEKWNYNMFFRPYPCGDGEWIALAFNYTKDWQKACDVFEFEEFRNDPRFQTQGALRVSEVCKELTDALRAKLLTQPRDYWLKALREKDLPCAPVQHGKDVITDPQVLENGFIEEVEFRNGTKVWVPTVPFQYSDYEIKPVKPGKPLGHDTREILAYLGYDDEKIEALTASGGVL